MVIKVSFDIITPDQKNAIVDHYNSHKPEEWNELCNLDRLEGGFCIARTKEEIQRCPCSNPFALDPHDGNYKIKQVRWEQKMLKCGMFFGFNEQETLLLYNAIVHVYGKEFVSLV